MNTITNEQIKQAFERPELLRELFPNAFKLNLEVGRWYVGENCKNGINLFNFSGDYDEDGDPLGYGFDSCQKWHSLNGVGWGCENIRPATAEEVETALIAEAKKRGYCDAKKIKGCNYHTEKKYFYSDGLNMLFKGTLFSANTAIFYKNKWAEIIKKTEIELTLDEIAEKFGVDKVKIKK